MYKLKEAAATIGVSERTLQRAVLNLANSDPELYKTHINKEGKSQILDDYIIKYFKGKLQPSFMIEAQQQKEAADKIIENKREVIEYYIKKNQVIQDELKDSLKEINKLRKFQIEHDMDIINLKDENANLRLQLENKNNIIEKSKITEKQNDELKNKIEELESTLARLRSRNLIDRIFNKE